MKQLTQKLKSGNMQLLEVPFPSLKPGTILVQNHFSCISAGTESSTVSAARQGYIGKAKERPQQVKQVFESLHEKGIVQTYRAVMKKLDAHSPLGYSCAGQVVGVGLGVTEFTVGDLVACGGLTACHAEIVSVPVNLCVKLESATDLKQAAYNTLGAIALQGVRQADLRLGECCAVIGLGLLGQLTGVLLKASGVKVIGIDVNPAMVEMALKHCCDLSLARDTVGIEALIQQFTYGYGCDAVIITAAAKSLDPINFAGAIAKKKGLIVVSGAVPTGFDREPHFYKKELTLKMSCSYGPGRYDPQYEEKGIDYPFGYVRWTEKRNMIAFQELIEKKRIDIHFLTTHIFPFDQVPNAYDMILERSEPFVGILVEYEKGKDFSLAKGKTFTHQGKITRQAGKVTIGFLGAGSYAQSYLLPNIPKNADVVLKGVMTSSSAGSRSVADRFGFEFCTGEACDILENDEINTVFIATRHDSHGRYVSDALQAGKNVFVEKPLCLSMDELKLIKSLLNRNDAPLLMVGFNRRFAPLSSLVQKKIGPGTMSIMYRVNAGRIEKDSWIQDPDLGGGRIIGEVCHFIDFLTFINGSLPVSVFAKNMLDAENLNDTLTISMAFQNGSIGSILYFANGAKSFGKEYIEIYRNGTTSTLNDFKELDIFGAGKTFRKKLRSQDKGQKYEIEMFINALNKGLAPPISSEEILSSSEVSFKIIESIQTGNIINL